MPQYKYLQIPCSKCGAIAGEYCHPKIDGDEPNAQRYAQCVERLREYMRHAAAIPCGQCIQELSTIQHWRHTEKEITK